MTPGGEPVRARGLELVVSGALVALAVLIVTDSLRVGTGWADDGPRSGYFPFYIGLALGISAGMVFVRQLIGWARDQAVFAERAQLKQVLSVLVPMVVYVALIFPLGIYLASALLIGGFMMALGRYRWTVALPVALGVPVFFFVVFERWFLVPLPKGPIERLLGF